MHEDVALAPTVAIPAVTDEPEAAPPAPTRRGASVLGLVAEGAVALGAAAVLTLLSTTVNVNPLDRIGQVSGLAGIQLRFAVLGVLVIAAVLVVSRLRGTGSLPTLTRFGSAAIAGLASGFTAGGLVLALRGTSLPLNATRVGGDFSAIAGWAESIIAGYVGPRPRDEAQAAELRVARDAEVLRHVAPGVEVDLRSTAQVKVLLKGADPATELKKAAEQLAQQTGRKIAS